MICRVYDRASQAKLIDKVIVATDDERIFNAVKEYGGEVMMTRADHPTGTDRLAEVAADDVRSLYAEAVRQARRHVGLMQHAGDVQRVRGEHDRHRHEAALRKEHVRRKLFEDLFCLAYSLDGTEGVGEVFEA